MDLVRRAGLGERAAIDALCERLSCVPAMLRELHRRHGAPLGRDELSEVEQETLAAVWSKLADYEGRASIESWVYRFTVLELLKGLDRRRRARRIRGEEPGALELVEQPLQDEPLLDPAILRDALERLGPPASDIVRLRHFDELGFEQIALRFGEPLNTIKARYYRGLERLGDLLRPQIRKVSR